jgi:PKD repeat protein
LFIPEKRRYITTASTLLLAALGACTPDRVIPTLPDAGPQTQPAAPAVSRSTTEGYASRGELREGYVLNRFGKPMQVQYEVHNGVAVWEGDIELGRASQVSTTAAGARAFTRQAPLFSRGATGPDKTVIIDGAGFRWPGGVVPYEIDPALTNTQRLTDAIAMIEETTGGVTVVPRSGQADYVKYIPSDGCSSAIGRQGGEQTIKLGDGCTAGNAAHETMHALGMFHEQSRCDRDTYVEILIANVESGKENNFDKECDGATDLGDNYDFGSMMHYSLDAFSSNGMPTMKLRPGITYSGTIGQRAALSTLDRFTLNYLYGTNNKPPVPIIAPFAASYNEGSPVAMDATGSTDADDKKLTYRWNFGDDSCFAFPEPADCTQAKPNHVYANDGVYKVGLFVWDGYEEEATEAFVTIKNVKPDIFLNLPSSVDEGSPLTSAGGGFSDPGADFWSATVNYGDGGGANALSLIGKGFLLAHTYADNGSYTVTVAVKDDDETSTKTGTQLVNNVAPTVDAGADKTFTSGQTFNFAGSFTDPGANDSPWSWSIDWGVGTPTTGSTNTRGAINASNRVCGAGTYNVTLSVTDKDGGKGSDAAQVTVGYVVVDLSIMPGTSLAAISIKKTGSLPVAILSSSTFDARTVDVASIRIGDEVGTDTPVAMQKGKYLTRVEDVNGDGRLDLVMTFDVPTMVSNGDLKSSTTSLVVRGFQGATGDTCINFRGVGSVKVNS